MSFDSTPPPVSTAPTPPPAGQVAPGSGLPVNIAAGLASLFVLPGGVVFMFLDRKDAYVRFYALQAIILGCILFLIWMLQWLLASIFGAIPLLGVYFVGGINFVFAILRLAWMIIWIISTVCAFSGKQWRLPFLSEWLKRYISRIP